MKINNTLLTVATVIALVGCASTAPQEVAQTSTMNVPSAGTVAGSVVDSAVPSAATVTGQLPSAGAAGIAGNVVGSAAPTAAQAPGLVDILAQQLGISQAQATGGAGSIFSLAQQSMTPSNFGVISQAVPGMDSILAAAPSASTPNLMGSTASALGGGSNLGNLATLASSFQSLGMGSNMVNQFIPVILQYMQDQGGSTAMTLLQSVLLP